jgi:DNA-binding LytR/AlgR family response regulator
MNPRAIIADDEKRLAEHLAGKLSVLWPDLVMCGIATNGTEALAMINREKPDVAFLDIHMPGMTGLEVVRRMTHSALVVFITAFDKYAVESFEEEAIDYVLKPVSDERLSQTIRRIRKRLEGTGEKRGLDSLLEKLDHVIVKHKDSYVRWLRAESGKEVHLIPVETILFIQSRNKYTAVVTRDGEFLMRTPISSLLEQLDPKQFWQIHRSTIVNVSKIQSVKKGEQQRHILCLRDYAELLTVSRQFAHLFSKV